MPACHNERPDPCDVGDVQSREDGATVEQGGDAHAELADLLFTMSLAVLAVGVQRVTSDQRFGLDPPSVRLEQDKLVADEHLQRRWSSSRPFAYGCSPQTRAGSLNVCSARFKQ